jgi:large subunit ribosomal protein L23
MESEILLYPLSTEKTLRLMESENQLVFIVSLKARKANIKQAFEEMFKVKVVQVNTLVTPKGKKKAYIKLSPEHLALDIATQLGMM